MRIKDLQNALSGLIGWEQSPENTILDELTKTSTGLTYNGAHPLITIDNIRAIMPDNYGNKYDVWNAEKEYKKGDKVKTTTNGSVKYWIALNENIASEPSESASDWSAFDIINDYLLKLQNDGIAQMVQKYITNKELTHETRQLVEHKTMFDGAGNLKNVLYDHGHLVGFEIVPIRSAGVTTQIHRVGLQMSGATGVVKLYLFHSDTAEPIKTFELDYTKQNGGFQWFELDECFLPYVSDATNAGGAWYLCYNENELPVGMLPIIKNKDWSREPCNGCNAGDLATYRLVSKYLQVSPFKTVPNTDFETNPTIPDVEKLAYTNTYNYGLNFEISVGCDLTDFIITAKNMFAYVLRLQVAYNVLRTLAMNPSVRVNRNQANVDRMEILYEIDGNTNGRLTGLGAELEKAYKAINLSTAGLDRVCLPCNNNGVNYSVV